MNVWRRVYEHANFVYIPGISSFLWISQTTHEVTILVSCTIVGILIESIAKMKLLCCKEIFFEETNWEIGYLALDLFPFLNAIGKSFRSTSRLSKIWVGERGNIVFNTYLRLDQLKLLGQFGISISLLHQFWEATTDDITSQVYELNLLRFT